MSESATFSSVRFPGVFLGRCSLNESVERLEGRRGGELEIWTSFGKASCGVDIPELGYSVPQTLRRVSRTLPAPSARNSRQQREKLKCNQKSNRPQVPVQAGDEAGNEGRERHLEIPTAANREDQKAPTRIHTSNSSSSLPCAVTQPSLSLITALYHYIVTPSLPLEESLETTENNE